MPFAVDLINTGKLTYGANPQKPLNLTYLIWGNANGNIKINYNGERNNKNDAFSIIGLKNPDGIKSDIIEKMWIFRWKIVVYRE